MKKVAVLGSTGSIGTQTLQVIKSNPDKLQAVSLVAFSNGSKLTEQAREYGVNNASLISERGEECLIDAVKNCDVAVIATKGIAALEAVIYCLEHGIDVAIANKEVLVTAGELVMSKVGKSKLYPVDSEHCAISRCLAKGNKDRLSKILLTASGGPFWNTPKEDLCKVGAAQALNHPNWSMGSKITVDSATMMNKSLEVIEASWLFKVPTDKISIIVHRQSIVHSMVEFFDGGVIAQLASPDMRLPIQTALLEDEGNLKIKEINFDDLLTLTFEKCDYDRFPCARLGYEINEYPSLCATVMNAANDVCVENFCSGKLLFTQFYNIIIKAVERFSEDLRGKELTLQNIKECDRSARIYTQRLIGGEIC